MTAHKLYNYLTFQSFDLERTWRLSQRRVVCSKLDIYVFILLHCVSHIV